MEKTKPKSDEGDASDEENENLSFLLKGMTAILAADTERLQAKIEMINEFGQKTIVQKALRSASPPSLASLFSKP